MKTSERGFESHVTFVENMARSKTGEYARMAQEVKDDVKKFTGLGVIGKDISDNLIQRLDAILSPKPQ